MNIELNDLEVAALRQAFKMYQDHKRKEAAQNKDANMVKKYASLLGVIETLQEKIGHMEDSR